jgi:hypothetical protein
MPGGLKCKLDISVLQQFGDIAGRAQLSIKVDVTANLSFGFFRDDFDELFGVFMLHAIFYFFQSHLPKVFNCAHRTGVSKN